VGRCAGSGGAVGGGAVDGGVGNVGRGVRSGCIVSTGPVGDVVAGTEGRVVAVGIVGRVVKMAAVPGMVAVPDSHVGQMEREG
jgi:hypothetical protein